MNRLKWQWDENPMLAVLLFFTTGLWSGKELSNQQLALAASFFLLLWTGAFLSRNRHYRLPAILRTSLAWAILWGAGAGLSVFRQGAEELPEHAAFYGIITEPGDMKENGSRRCLARILRVREKNGRWHNMQGSAMLWFRGQAAAGFRSGQTFISNIPLRGIPAPALPGEFNAKAWYQSQGIFWQASIPENQFHLLGLDSGFSLRQMAITCRKSLEEIFHQYLPENEDAAVLSALLLGIRRKMDPELKEAYAAAGLTHILAVSGMHVALIYSFLSFLFSGLRKLKSGRIFFSISITSLLWFYALITGLSPSVLRAVCLFSIMQFSDVLRKPSLPVNNLCFASIILLLADENLLYDLGYQLSFSAVYGILSFQPAIAQFWQPKNKYLQSIRDNLSVTLAASLSTLPLILYHFHRFPAYFLFSNLLAVPFSNLLIYAGIALIISSPVSFAGNAIGTGLHYAFALLNGFVSFVNKLPFSSFNNLYPGVFLFTLLILAVLCLQHWLMFRKTTSLNLLMVIALLAIIQHAVFTLFLPENKDGLFAIRYRKSWFILAEKDDRAQLQELNQGSPAPLFLHAGLELKSLKIRQATERFIQPGDGLRSATKLLRFQHQTILVLNHYLKGNPPEKPLPLDMLVMAAAGEKSLRQALKFFKPRLILSDWPGHRVAGFQSSMPGCPPILNFRYQKFRKIGCLAEKGLPAPDREYGYSKTN